MIGWTLVIAGGVGFLYSSAFGAPGKVESVFGILDVNGWHNVFHIVTGLVGLMCAGSYRSARGYAIGLALLYAALAIWGFVLGSGQTILSIIPVNTEDSVLHALIAVGACVAGLATPPAQRPTTQAQMRASDVRMRDYA